ncbi:MAG: methyltransferase domain-containing protein [Pseudomonadota bacterium]|nr:methyltransferase domain-containing protein [Pseudomonadota bacterium]
MKLENRGSTTLESRGEAPFVLSYYWIDANGLKLEGVRTELLDPLPPGRSITMPLFIQTPKKAGRFTLSIRSLVENVRWFDDFPVEYEIDIGRGPSTADEPKWKKTGRLFDYMADHFEGVRLLTEWRDTLFDRPVERVVELGGNASPMIERFDAPLKYNVDVDAYGMIVGNLARADRDSTVTFIVADGMDLPMRPRSIDMIVLFATFHHFPDPIGLLSRLSEFVVDDGLICLMCEPIGHMHRDTVTQEFLTEIRRGVNEQSFELWEYQQMFDAAKLDVVAAQIDIGSVKIALRPQRR